MEKNERLIVIGLDGANREALVKGINSGKLPTMAEIASGGGISTLRAPLPPTTPVSMSSILTGVYPDRHGIFGFEKGPGESYVDRRDIQESTVLELLDDAGRKTVSINTPMTSPAPEVDGYVVGGFPSSGRKAWPPTLEQELEEEGYEVEQPGFGDDFVDDIFERAEERFQLALELVEKEWDLFFLTFTGDARLQHFIDDTEVLMEFYEKVDEYLAELLEKAEGSRAIIVSDHGFHDLEVEFDIGSWLEEEGYLESAGEADWSRLYGELGESTGSKAVPGGAYLGNLFVEEELEEELMEKLGELEHDGEKVFRDVHLARELYGEVDGPDLVPVPTRGFNYVAGTGETFDDDPGESRAPDREGVLISDFELDGDRTPESVDVLPTVLDILGVDRGGFDGSSLQK